MKNNKVTPEQEKIIDTLHNLIWHRITHDDDYLENIPEIEKKDLHDWIYYVKYEFIEYDNSIINAVVYLNGKHYEYTEAPQISNGIIWVNDIEDSQVKAKIIELGGEIYGDFELYNPNQVLDKEVEERLNNLFKGKGFGFKDLP